jgi:hypothetical protein
VSDVVVSAGGHIDLHPLCDERVVAIERDLVSVATADGCAPRTPAAINAARVTM